MYIGVRFTKSLQKFPTDFSQRIQYFGQDWKLMEKFDIWCEISTISLRIPTIEGISTSDWTIRYSLQVQQKIVNIAHKSTGIVIFGGSE